MVPSGGFEKEKFSLCRESGSRGRPYNKFFSEAVAPAMLTTGATGVQITEILRLYDLRYYEPGEGPSDPPGPDWWQDRRHVGGGMAGAYAWYRIATAESVLQGGFDETKIDHVSRLNMWLVRHDEGGEREGFNMGTCKVLIDGTAEGGKYVGKKFTTLTLVGRGANKVKLEESFVVLKIYWEEKRKVWFADCVEIDDEGEIPAASRTPGGVVRGKEIIPFTLEEMEKDIARYEGT